VAPKPKKIDLDVTYTSDDTDSFMTPNSGEGSSVMECEP
jgi:hypothetical protein